MGLFGGEEAPEVTNDPWSGVDGQLKDMNRASGKAVKKALANQYTGGIYAGPNATQTGANLALGQFGNGAAGDLAAGSVNAAGQMSGAGVNYGANADQIFDQYGGSATQGILNRTGQYMNDPVMNAQIEAMRANAGRDLAEGLAPMQSGFAANGNTNSSRAGVAEGIVRRGANDAATAAEADMRQAQYNQALQASQNDYFQGGGLALAANDQVGDAFNTGMDAADRAITTGQRPINMMAGAGGQQQQWAQTQLDADKAKWDQGTNQTFDVLDRANSIYGPQSGYGVQSGGAPAGNGMFGQLAGAATLAAGAYFAPATGGASLAAGAAAAGAMNSPQGQRAGF